MKKLAERLEKADIFSIQLEKEIDALWKYGVEKIADEKLRQAIVGFLCSAVPLVFFTDHASRSGRFHPPWQNQKHGTLRSIIESCVLLPGLAQHFPELFNEDMEPKTEALDIAFAATIISDTWKKADAYDIHYGSRHGRIAAEYWQEYATKEGIDPALIKEIAHCSVWHHGIYAPDWEPGIILSPLVRLVNLCDVVTSLTALATIYNGKIIVR